MRLMDERYCAWCGDMIPGGKRFFMEIGNETTNWRGKHDVAHGREYCLCRACAQDLITKFNSRAWQNARSREKAMEDVD